MPRPSVVYLMSGDAHAAYLAVSLTTLRRWYSGEVVVYAYPESLATVRCIAADSRLGVRAEEWQPVCRPKKNGQFVNKIALMQSLEGEANLYLDADTMVMDSVDSLFELAKEHGFVATQFNQWLSNGGSVRSRVERLVGREPISQNAVQWVLRNPLPSVNGGVFACRPDSPVLSLWWDWTMSVMDIFIADETVLHAIMGVYHEIDGFHVATGGRWNCSPKYQPSGLPDSSVAIWHFHGDSNVRPDKSKKGMDIWWPEYQLCKKENVGGIGSWISSVIDKNRFLKAVENHA